MLRKYPVVFIALFFFSACNDKAIKSDEKKEQAMVLKNKIKTITEYRSNVFLGVKQTEQLSEVKTYNGRGLKTREVAYTNDGAIDLIITYQYDTKDNLIAKVAVNNDNNLIFKDTRSYDAKNNRKELYHYLPDGTYKYKNIASYDDNYRMTELAWYWPTGFVSKNVYSYNGFNKISDTEYSANGKITYEWEFKYNPNDNLIEATQYYPGNILTRKITYEYNSQNQLVKQTTFTGESVENTFTCQYDSKNLLSQKTEYSSAGKIAAAFRYLYEFNYNR
jgi:hypothetical protein